MSASVPMRLAVDQRDASLHSARALRWLHEPLKVPQARGSSQIPPSCCTRLFLLALRLLLGVYPPSKSWEPFSPRGTYCMEVMDLPPAASLGRRPPVDPHQYRVILEDSLCCAKEGQSDSMSGEVCIRQSRLGALLSGQSLPHGASQDMTARKRV